jgi:hypothetical protein
MLSHFDAQDDIKKAVEWRKGRPKEGVIGLDFIAPVTEQFRGKGFRARPPV